MNSSIDLCQVPAGPSPTGESNFVNPTSLAPALMGVIGFTVAWATVFTAARFYINIRKLGWADYFNLIALLMSISILGLEATQLKAARHIWDVPACFFDADYARGIFIPAALLQLGSFFAKASIFLLYLQLFTIEKTIRIAIYAGLAFNFLLYLPGVAVAAYYETPRAGESWVAILDGRTLIPLRWWQVQSALSIVLDLYIFVLPMPVLARLKMPMQKRISVIAVFSLALMGIAASIASLVERIQITHTNDTTWISAILSLCSSVELNVAIIVSSAPAFSSFARSHLADLSVVKLLLSSFSYTNRSKSYDLEATPGGSTEKINDPPAGVRSDSAGSGAKATPGRSSRYYDLNDTWMLQSGACADQDRMQTMPPADLPGNGIMRTVGIEQAVRTVE